MFSKLVTFFILPTLIVVTIVMLVLDQKKEEAVIFEYGFNQSSIEYEQTLYTISTFDVSDEVIEDVIVIQESSDIPENLRCPDYYSLAKEVGWEEKNIERLDYVIWRESRCDSYAHNKYDPASGSRGIIQINGFWCRPNSYTENGFLQDHGILNSCEDLFDPEINLKAGLLIYNYGVEKHGCGWGPWSTRKSAWCKK
jgi:hypothetical protein